MHDGMPNSSATSIMLVQNRSKTKAARGAVGAEDMYRRSHPWQRACEHRWGGWQRFLLSSEREDQHEGAPGRWCPDPGRWHSMYAMMADAQAGIKCCMVRTVIEKRQSGSLRRSLASSTVDIRCPIPGVRMNITPTLAIPFPCFWFSKQFRTPWCN